MNPRDAFRNLRTGDVEIGLGPLKRMASEVSGWVCEHCGTTKGGKSAPGRDVQPRCKSKSGSHKWRRV